MLSRVASNLCWLGRYLERAENTARLLNVNSNLLLDLPKNFSLGWQPIVDILSNREVFSQLYSEPSEKNVVRFIYSDTSNRSSIMSSLAFARENARTIREIIPREAWEQINELYLFAAERTEQAMVRRNRYDLLAEAIEYVQKITGILAGTMLHDEGYNFLRVGRNLERADMTTRIIDVRSANLFQEIETEQSAFENLQWMSVLKSLTAYQMYRREMRLRIRRTDVLKFLLLDERFPRSLLHTLHQARFCVSQLPNSQTILEQIAMVEKQLAQAEPQALIQQELHEFIDDMQLGIINIFRAMEKAYF